MKVHQICARLQFGDAVTNDVLGIHRFLLEKGLESHVYAHYTDDYYAGVNEGEEFYARKFLKDKKSLLIYHYSVYDDNYRLYQRSKNRKVLIYHNITPPRFFQPYSLELAEICRKGRELLPSLRHCDLALGDTDYNRQELLQAGFDPAATGVLPIFIDFQKMEDEDEDLTERLRTNTVNILFLGRMVPNKRIEDLIAFFAYYHNRVNAASRLWVVGSSWLSDYNRKLLKLVQRNGLLGKVSFPGGAGGVTDKELVSYFRSAQIFMTMSEHEGFCVPLVESMYHSLPIFAYAEAAVPETLGGCGVLFHRKVYPVIAAAVEEVLRDGVLHEDMVRRQRSRLRDFSTEVVEETLWNYISPLLK